MTAKNKPAINNDKNTLRITSEPGKSEDRKIAEVSLSPISLNTVTARIFVKPTMGEIDLSEAIYVMRDKVSKINAGDTSELEATLTAQTVSLDAMFNELARRAVLNMGEYMQAAETYMRLALKAQAQCARTIEVIAAMKNPPIVFAKQANISHGHQQVNNATSTHAPAHTGETVNQSNELLEHQHHGEWLDSGKTATTSGTDSALETVGTVNRGAND